MINLYMTLSASGVADIPIEPVDLPDMEQRIAKVGDNFNWNFNQWGEWLSITFPEISEPSKQTLLETGKTEGGSKPAEDSPPSYIAFVFPAEAKNWADSWARFWVPFLYTITTAQSLFMLP